MIGEGTEERLTYWRKRAVGVLSKERPDLVQDFEQAWDGAVSDPDRLSIALECQVSPVWDGGLLSQWQKSGYGLVMKSRDAVVFEAHW